MTTEEKVYQIQAGGDTLEEFLTDVISACSRVGSIAVQDNNSGKKQFGKLVVNTTGEGTFVPSFQVEWPDVRIGKLQPRYAKLTLLFSDLQTPSKATQMVQSRAATIQADLKRLMAEAARLGVEVPSAGDEE
jgi:hypothetical protein